MNTPAFVVVRTTRTEIEANLIISILRSNGLHPLDLRTASNFSFGGADISYEVEIPFAEAKAAKEFLKALDTPIRILPLSPSQNPSSHRPRKSGP